MARTRKPKAVPSSSESIAKLRASGQSFASIGRALGRDSSLISQIARGKKPGANLSKALNALASGKKIKAPERRKTKSGQTVKVRTKRRLPSGGIKVKPKTIDGLIDALKFVSSHNGSIRIYAQWKSVPGLRAGDSNNLLSIGFELFGNGYKAAKVLKEVRRYERGHRATSRKEMLEGYLAKQFRVAFQSQGKGQTNVEGLGNVTIVPTYPKAQ
jgi:transcriptional regulator